MTSPTSLNRNISGDCRIVLRTLPAAAYQTCVTSPPYWGLRDYGSDSAQIGLEATVDEYVAALVDAFDALRRVLTPDGTAWLVLGDSYACAAEGTTRVNGKKRVRSGDQVAKHNKVAGGLKPKDLVGVPWRVALALQACGWWLRSEVIWSKPNPVPESCRDRPTRSHEHAFLLSVNEGYHYNTQNGREPARFSATGDRNLRTVWTFPTEPYDGAHLAPMPRTLVRRCLRLTSKPGAAVIDPFMGSGTVAQVAHELGLPWTGIDLCPTTDEHIGRRLAQQVLALEVSP